MFQQANHGNKYISVIMAVLFFFLFFVVQKVVMFSCIYLCGLSAIKFHGHTDTSTMDVELESRSSSSSSKTDMDGSIDGNDRTGSSTEDNGAPVLETAHVYSVEKQQVAIVQVGGGSVAQGGTPFALTCNSCSHLIL